MNNKWIMATFLVLSQVLLWPFASAQAVWAPYNWVITIKTEQVDGEFNYSGSKLKPVVKGSVSYASVDDISNDFNYEDLWFCQGKPYGLERNGPLAIPRGDGVAIHVIHTDDHGTIDNHATTQDELAAAADSILRIVIDAQINQNIVHTIIVPASSFQGICQSLQNHHFELSTDTVETPHLAGAYLFLVDDADKRRQSLRYSP